MPRRVETGALSLRERLTRIENSLEKLKHRTDYILIALAAAGAGTLGFSGLEALAATWP